MPLITHTRSAFETLHMAFLREGAPTQSRMLWVARQRVRSRRKGSALLQSGAPRGLKPAVRGRSAVGQAAGDRPERADRWYMLLCVCAVLALLAGACHEDAEESTDPGAKADAAAVVAAKAEGGLTDVTEHVGLAFLHHSGAGGSRYMPEIMGGGVALFDMDGDGDLDVYLTNGNDLLPEAGNSTAQTNRLFRQDAGGTFQGVTEGSGLGDGGYGMGVAVGDMDNDGLPDVYVTNYGPDRLYRNLGGGRFGDVTAAAGIDVPGWSASAAFVDLDRDGFLDLYVTQYLKFDRFKKCTDRAGRADYCNPQAFLPVDDVLLRNRGDGTFADVSKQAGIRAVSACAGMGVVCADFNEDGWQDIYVANDGYRNQLWINNADGTFADRAVHMGAAFNGQGMSEAGMGVTSGDFDGDGHIDLFVTHLANETNTLYRNLGRSKGFVDATIAFGLGRSSLAHTGFGAIATDLDWDGDLDLLIANGRVSRARGSTSAPCQTAEQCYAENNLIYINDGRGVLALPKNAKDAGRPVAFGSPVEISRGLAAGDIDRDGDQDFILVNMDGPARLYRNECARPGHWLAVRAVDPRYHRDAIGAVVRVVAGGRTQVRTITRASSYLSSSEPVARFGLGEAARIDRIRVAWPDGKQEVFRAPSVDRALTLLRGSGE